MSRRKVMRLGLTMFVTLFVAAGSLLFWRSGSATTTAVHDRPLPCQHVACPRPVEATPSPPSSPSAIYLALGRVPIAGLEVGATFYGALESPQDGHYIPSNYLQGGVKNDGAYDGYDDNGEGACGGAYTRLDGDYATWAEDGNGSILGGLPCGTKLEIKYHNRTVVAEKGDTSNGGCTPPASRCSDNGHERAIDLWWQTARALCFSEQPDVVTIHIVPSSTPTTNIATYDVDNAESSAVCR